MIIAGFGAIGKSYIGQRFSNIIDMESGDFAHINTDIIHLPIEERKGTTIRPPHPQWPEYYYTAIQDARKIYDIVLTSMHWDLLRFYENNEISYYLVSPGEGLE